MKIPPPCQWFARGRRHDRRITAIDICGDSPQNAGMEKQVARVSLGCCRKKGRPLHRHLFLIALALAAALFLMLCLQVHQFTASRHPFRPALGPLLLAMVVFYLLLAGVWALSGRVLSNFAGISREEALSLDFATYAPLAFLMLAPLALGHYLTRDDLWQRLRLFALAVIAAVLYLKIVRYVQSARTQRPGRRSLWETFLRWPLSRRIALLAFISIILTHAGARVMTTRGMAFGGDEPHYLMIAHSLASDGDIDLANNYQNGDFKNFMPPQVSELEPHHAPVKKAGSMYSFHSPGISILLLPFYALGLALGKGMLIFLVRFAMSLIGAFLGIQIYLYARETWQREKLALALWALAVCSAPIFFYATHVYTEIAVAAFGLFIFRRLQSSATLHVRILAMIGFLLASFVWFHALKYWFIQASLCLYALLTVWRGSEAKDRFRRLAAFLVPAGLCFAAYFVFQHAVYGSVNPTSVSFQGAMDGQQTMSFFKSLWFGIPWKLRWETLAGYFLDQRDGLLLYAPIYLFASIGMVAMFRARSREAFWLLLIAGPYILLSAFLTQRTGFAPQARPLVPIIWILVIFIGAFLAESGKRIFAYLFRGAICLSLLITWLLCLNPFALYQETTFGNTERAGTLFLKLSNLHFYLPGLLPSFIKVDGGRWPQNSIWLLALVLFIAAYFFMRGRDWRMTYFAHTVTVFVLLVVFFWLFVLFPRPVLVLPRQAAMPAGEEWTFYSLSLMARMGEPGKFALLQDGRDYDFYFSTRKPLEKLEVVFGSLHGEYVMRLQTADEKAFAVKTRREVLSRTIVSPPVYRWKGRNLYRLSIRLDKKSDVRTAVTPYVFALGPGR